MEEKIIGTLNDEVDPVSKMTERQKLIAFSQAVEAASVRYGLGMEPQAVVGPDGRVKRLYIEVIPKT